jgi:hypothetical protein
MTSSGLRRAARRSPAAPFEADCTSNPLASNRLESINRSQGWYSTISARCVRLREEAALHGIVVAAIGCQVAGRGRAVKVAEGEQNVNAVADRRT